ncbi:PREDICTED: uncharacterized protein LOC106793181 [Polistes canadensis]|uniref:uncharacterized protein LOC106793181 n=1 Tax=Polistes canadensis TaxID=91411 RepID=UPI000718D1E2|nr:PREDICTED: uncharacterized protein LOC106793181 [Polistes canadensis]
MEKIEHLWNVTQYLTKFQCPEANKLQNHYIERCRNLANEVELPKLCFGPSTMCSHCGSLWATTNHQVRILPGKKMSRSVGKMIKTNTDENKISKLQAKLIKKCKKNEMNKMSIRCFACLRCTEVRFTKPKRIVKTSDNALEKSNIQQKKKKRKGKDKTVGLNISGNLTSKLQSSESQKTPVTNKTNQSKMNLNKPKLKKLNINKLKDIVNQGMTPPNRKSLTNFLKELS